MYLEGLRVPGGDGISGSPRGVTPTEMATLGDAGRGVGVSQTVLVPRTGGFQPQRRWEQGGGPPGPPGSVPAAGHIPVRAAQPASASRAQSAGAD